MGSGYSNPLKSRVYGAYFLARSGWWGNLSPRPPGRGATSDSDSLLRREEVRPPWLSLPSYSQRLILSLRFRTCSISLPPPAGSAWAN